MARQSKRHLGRLLNCAVLLLLVVSTAACGGEAASSYKKIGSGFNSAPAPTSDSSTLPGMAPQAPAAASDATATTGSAAYLAEPGEAGEAPARGVRGFDDAAGDSAGTVRRGTVPPSNYQSPLTAGQVDDNAKFQEYLDYLQRHPGEAATPMDVSQRLFLKVVDNQQRPVAGARVQLSDGQRILYDGQTVSDGRVLFFPSMVDATQLQGLHATVSRGNSTVETEITMGGPEQVIAMPGLTDNEGPVSLDLVFLLDATGSMGDEIDSIKATVGSIAQRIEQLPGSSAPRFGLVAFRDRGDDYVTRTWDFTGDIAMFAGNLSNVYAGGGGDTPESVNEGLYEAINLPGWADNSTGRHLRMIVLVGDAPPHIDYPNDYAYPALLQQAVSKGIKIFPIGASNLDTSGEYVFRQFAQVTQGQFIFLTYANGVSGEPGVGTTNDVPAGFTVQNLDSLVVNLVAGEVANQTGEKVQSSNTVSVPVAATVAQPVAQSETLLSSVQGILQTASRDLFTWGTLFWLALLGGMIFVAQRIPQQRARVASIATTEASSGEDPTFGDITVPRQDEQYVLLPKETILHAPYIDYAAPQPTVPLPSIEAAMREYQASTSTETVRKLPAVICEYEAAGVVEERSA